MDIFDWDVVPCPDYWLVTQSIMLRNSVRWSEAHEHTAFLFIFQMSAQYEANYDTCFFPCVITLLTSYHCGWQGLWAGILLPHAPTFPLLGFVTTCLPSLFCAGSDGEPVLVTEVLILSSVRSAHVDDLCLLPLFAVFFCPLSLLGHLAACYSVHSVNTFFFAFNALFFCI